ncbi:hypothetical protein KSS87_018405 [Heliosperma pusillum]|nr:hypothetical protein KSS87_018405 [Heliosperma pusillum]
MAAAAIAAAIAVVLMAVVVESRFTVYNTTAKLVTGKLNVHLVPHTHDDAGWLKTVDQYYVGSNNSIQAFFQRWWREQNEAMQNIVKDLVKSGQLEFINGGMVMHDEASPHYIDMIDQTTLGHQFLKQEFGVIPRIGWQIDPFGHSAVQAYLLGAEDREKRMNDKSLEVVWQGSESLGPAAQIFTGAFWKGNYEPPTGFYFEVNDDSPIVQDDPDLFDYNVQERVNDFVSVALSQANVTRTNHIMWTMGTDFKYQYAHTWFRQMDKLIHYVNLVIAIKKTLHGNRYADRINAYWTGYFTSRPALKRYVREMSAYYMAARQLEYFIGKRNLGHSTDALGDALAIAQHHDAVTGTEKQHVANDYAKRLSVGYKECPLMNISYCPASEIGLSRGKNLIAVVYNPLGWQREDIIRFPVTSENVMVRDYEGREIESQILPISDVQLSMRNFHVTSYLGAPAKDTPKYWLAFSASVPPLGFSTKLARSSVHRYKDHDRSTFAVGPGALKLTFSKNGKLTYHNNNRRNMDTKSLEVSYSYYAGFNGTDTDTQASGAYVFRPNGTYDINAEKMVASTVMRGPLIDEVHQQINSWLNQITRVYKDKEHVEVEYVVGPIPIDDGVGKEVVAKFTGDLMSNKIFYTDSNGRDFIKRIRDYRSDWDLQVNQPVAGNYYPINLGLYLHDDVNEFSVMVDRAIGGSSIKDGQIEMMLHRRLLKDDGRGVAEALNETVCTHDKCIGLTVQGKLYFRIDPRGEGAKWRRSFGQQLYSPFLLAFSAQDEDNWQNSHEASFTGIDPSYSFPENVALITLQIGKVTETSLSANQERSEMQKKRLVWKSQGASVKEHKIVRGGPIDPAKLVLQLAPMEIRTIKLRTKITKIGGCELKLSNQNGAPKYGTTVALLNDRSVNEMVVCQGVTLISKHSRLDRSAPIAAKSKTLHSDIASFSLIED